MTEKEIVVMLPIKIPNSKFCYHKEKGFRCQYFSLLIGCYNGFKPQKKSDTVYTKDLDCLRLLWQENLK